MCMHLNGKPGNALNKLLGTIPNAATQYEHCMIIVAYVQSLVHASRPEQIQFLDTLAMACN